MEPHPSPKRAYIAATVLIFVLSLGAYGLTRITGNTAVTPQSATSTPTPVASASNTPTPTTSPITTPSTTTQTSGTYTSSSTGVSFTYPKEWTLEETTTKPLTSLAVLIEQGMETLRLYQGSSDLHTEKIAINPSDTHTSLSAFVTASSDYTEQSRSTLGTTTWSCGTTSFFDSATKNGGASCHAFFADVLPNNKGVVVSLQGYKFTGIEQSEYSAAQLEVIKGIATSFKVIKK